MTRPLYAVAALGVRLPAASGTRDILRNITFQVQPGEVIAIVGRSGVGKTTLLRVLGGLLPASSGTVVFDGAPVCGPPTGAVVVFQDYGEALLPWRTVDRNVALGRRSGGASKYRRTEWRRHH